MFAWQERTELQRELSDLRGKIAEVMREHPSIHFGSELQSLLQPEDQGDDDVAGELSCGISELASALYVGTLISVTLCAHACGRGVAIGGDHQILFIEM